MRSALHHLFVAFLPWLSLSLAAAEPTLTPKKSEAGKKSEAESKSEVTDPKDALAGIPRDIFKDLRAGSRTIDEAALKASPLVRKNVQGKTGKFTVTVGRIEKIQRNGSPGVTSTQIWSANESLREGGAIIKVFIVGTVVDDNEKDKLQKIKEGSKITITGLITSGEIVTPRKNVELHIDINDAKLAD